MSLNEKQWAFTHMVGKLILFAYERGYTLSFGDAYRSQAQAAQNAANGIGIRNSLHTQRLAVDLNLFINGEYQAQPEAYAELGAYWKSLDPLNAHGGDFKSRDANHFSMSHGGIR